MKAIFALLIIGFVFFCGGLVVESGLFEKSSKVEPGCILLQNVANKEESELGETGAADVQQMKAVETIAYGADHAPAKTIILGAKDPNTEDPDEGFKLQWELSSQGAAIRKATFSNGKNHGFDDRNRKDPQPLVFISPIQGKDGSEILTMANTSLVFIEQKLQLPLNKLHWKSFEPETDEDGSQTARFEAIIKNENTREPVLKLIKTYKISPKSYLFNCDFTIENLTDTEQKVRFNLAGPGGVNREAFRSDMRSVVAGFRNSQGNITSQMINIRNLNKAKNIEAKQFKQPGGNFLWVAAVNKYFAAIAVPIPVEDDGYCGWINTNSITGQFYNPDGDDKANSGDETVGVSFGITTSTLAPCDQADHSKTYNFQLYFGPKDKSLFDKNERYRELGFSHTITFMPCFCCPASIIHPLAFGILALMKWMHIVIPNYGVVIIILVFLMRLIMHPVTKKSQVSMSKMSTLAPKVEEIKKKYANNKAEMNKQMMALYREQGASPVMGMLPMMVQMPIWIALWSAVYASIDLRGAAFLPFWITDLSVPDAAWTFPRVLTVPILNWKIYSLNLLPILMGVAFYLQQKMMPSQANAATNPQVAQQQKMMKIMLPIMFPLMLYNGPAGVNLYIMASTFAGVVEQHVIRKHIREKEEAESKGLVAATSKTGGKVKKKKSKPFFKN
jgi:YidC/Oxa1 family membrane protein insertase